MNQYYYIDANGNQAGPVSKQDLRTCKINRQTFVWCEGMPGWAPAETVADLNEFFVSIPPIPPLPSSYTQVPQQPQPKQTQISNSQKTLLFAIGAIIAGGFTAIIIRYMGPYLSSLVGQEAEYGAYFLAILFSLIIIAIAVVIKNNGYRFVTIAVAIITIISACMWTREDTGGFGKFKNGYYHSYGYGSYSNRLLNKYGISVDD